MSWLNFGCRWQAAVLAAAGVAMLSMNSMGHSVDGPHGAVHGLLFTLIQPLAFGYGFYRTEKALAAVPDDLDLTNASLALGERLDEYSAAGGVMIVMACLLASGGFDG